MLPALACRLSDRAVLQIAGPTAAKFLQNLCSNDMSIYDPNIPPPIQRRMMRLNEAPAPRTFIPIKYAGFFNAKGRLLCDSFIIPNPSTSQVEAIQTTQIVSSAVEEFFVDCSAAISTSLLTHLRRYRLRDKLTIEDVSQDFQVFSALGPQPVCEHLSSRSFADPRRPELGSRVIATAAVASTASSAAQLFKGSFSEQSVDVFHCWRRALGVPEGPLELLPEQSLPIEAGLDLLHGISFEKGCYLGQELTSRVHHTGIVRKRIFPVLLTKNAPAAQDCQTRVNDLAAALNSQDLTKAHQLMTNILEDPAFLHYPEQKDIVRTDGPAGTLLGSSLKIGLAHLRTEHVLSETPLFCDENQELRVLPFVPLFLSKTLQAEQSA